MRIVDIFKSKQGEGIWTGEESAFIRVVGCNLRCVFCDTQYASWNPEDGEDLTLEEIAGRILLLDCKHVVLTGGEPMLFSEMIPLTRLLKEMNYILTVETSGTLELPVVCDLMSISPKLSNSTPKNVSSSLIRFHETNRSRPEIVRHLIQRYNYQLKFVIDEPEDLLEAEEYLAMFEEIDPKRALFMPLATDVSSMWSKAEWILSFCRKRGYQYCPRMQLEWYGNKRKT